MPDMSIRKFTDEQYTLIKAHAEREGQSMETWVKNLILQKVVNPPARLSPKAKEAWIHQRDKWMRAAAEMRGAELEMQRLVMAPSPAPEAVEYMVGIAEEEEDITYIFTKAEHAEYTAEHGTDFRSEGMTWEQVTVPSYVHMDLWVEQKKRWLQAAWAPLQTNEERREYALIMREAEWAMRSLEIHQCEYAEDGKQCLLQFEIYCDSGCCTPGRFYCAYHYREVHDPLLSAGES